MSLEALLQDCTVKLSPSNQQGWGTGFFVAPGLILTCAHVVKGPVDSVRVRWQRQDDFARAVVIERDLALDLALLQLLPEMMDRAADLPCVVLDDEVRAGQDFYFFGYPDREFEHGCPVTGSCEGLTGDVPPLIKFKLGQVRPGMSGSALLNRQTGKVCGMVKFTRDRASDLGGGAIPASVILERFPQLELLQQEFHRRDRRWEHQIQSNLGAVDTVWIQHTDATHITLAVLIGAWDGNNEYDLDAITQLLGISYDEWLRKAREILHHSNSPLSLKNGTWRVINRANLWCLLGSRIIDQDLDTFRSLAVSILKEPDPAFELPADKRHAASIYGKVLKYSHVLRKGIAEGLAILGSQPELCDHCSQGKAEGTCILAIRELLTDADWVLWGSLNSLLPTLAEVAPGEFLDAVEKALLLKPCPFDELFSQEGNGITGGNYLTGLLWALEDLAWDEQYLVSICVALSELASHDPGGQWANRPSNSLANILLPWRPQTLASFDKHKVAVRTILREYPDIAWNLIIQLLPGKHQSSFGSHKPVWRKTIPDDWEQSVTNQEYWQRVSFYAELAVAAADQDVARLSALIDHFDKLPRPAFDQLLQILDSQSLSELPEEQRFSIWNHLMKLIKKHRRFSNTEWALSNELITRIEQVTEKIAPTDSFSLYQHLFTERDFDFYEENGNWEKQQKKLDTQREVVVSKLFQQNGVEGIIQFAESVSSPVRVGYALGVITDPVIEQTLLPHFLSSANNRYKELVRSFIWRRYQLKNWEWCDDIDKSDWTPEQVGQFLACLPFASEAWGRASKWLDAHESEYWSRTGANTYQSDGGLDIAIEKLIENDRPRAAINCLERMRHDKQPIDCDQCVRALLGALSSSEPSDTMEQYHIIELIKFLQAEPSVNQSDLFTVEWSYLPWLDGYSGATPQFLEHRLADDPKFFCEIIQLIYPSKKENQPQRETTEKSREIAKNAWRLLDEWKTLPGTQKDGTFNEECLAGWIKGVREICTESGHLEIAFHHIGKVLTYAPPDSNGLWIHHVVAAELNDREADRMRDGFRIEIYNSRGVYFVDPTGTSERELAGQWRSKAEEVENAGFHRFAVTLRGLADEYDKEAGRMK